MRFLKSVALSRHRERQGALCGSAAQLPSPRLLGSVMYGQSVGTAAWHPTKCSREMPARCFGRHTECLLPGFSQSSSELSCHWLAENFWKTAAFLMGLQCGSKDLRRSPG